MADSIKDGAQELADKLKEAQAFMDQNPKVVESIKQAEQQLADAAEVAEVLVLMFW